MIQSACIWKDFSGKKKESKHIDTSTDVRKILKVLDIFVIWKLSLVL